MGGLGKAVDEHNVYRWAADFIGVPDPGATPAISPAPLGPGQRYQPDPALG